MNIGDCMRLAEWTTIVRSRDIYYEMMSVQIRPALAADAPRCGEILFRASEDFANRHHFARDYPTLEGATQYAEYVITHPCIYGVVAESNGELVGLNFLK